MRGVRGKLSRCQRKRGWRIGKHAGDAETPEASIPQRRTDYVTDADLGCLLQSADFHVVPTTDCNNERHIIAGNFSADCKSTKASGSRQERARVSIACASHHPGLKSLPSPPEAAVQSPTAVALEQKTTSQGSVQPLLHSCTSSESHSTARRLPFEPQRPDGLLSVSSGNRRATSLAVAWIVLASD